MNKVLVICPTYKESFILRRALIDMEMKPKTFLNNIKVWYNTWNHFNINTVYLIEDNYIGYCSKRFFYLDKREKYESYPRMTVNDFIKKYIRTYENN